MDTGILGYPRSVDRFLGVKPHPVDTTAVVFVVSCIRPQGNGKDRITVKKTHINPFTQEQIDRLKVNHYVRRISPSTISFTEEFKRYFCQKRLEGMPIRSIFLECGIDPDALGQSRIDGFNYTLNKRIKCDSGFKDHREHNYRRPVSTDKSTEGRIRQLEHELAYTRQEVEFLKKLQMADMEARRQWESKHQPQ